MTPPPFRSNPPKMSYGGGGGAYPGSSAIEIIPSLSSSPWPPPAAVWATDDDYNTSAPASSSSDPPPSKKPRPGATDAKAIGKMFFKTKLCCKFRAGTCPYITNCNFAHGMEELRRPPPNWQEIVAAASTSPTNPPREEHQIPILSSETLVGDPDQRSYKGRHCKKFYTGEGCPYGDSCTYLHDEQSKARESVAISLTSSIGPAAGGYGVGAPGQNQKPSNWKTRICNKWELTGYCPFGSKCHFAHGVAELHKYGGGLMDTEGKDASSALADSRYVGASARMPLDTVVASNTTGTHADVYHLGVPAQRSVGVSQRVGQRPLQKWKGPDKISRIYGDWIDENE